MSKIQTFGKLHICISKRKIFQPIIKKRVKKFQRPKIERLNVHQPKRTDANPDGGPNPRSNLVNMK